MPFGLEPDTIFNAMIGCFWLFVFVALFYPIVRAQYLHMEEYDPKKIKQPKSLIEKREMLRNAIIISFEMRGCMASESVFQYVGKVIGYEQTRFAGEAVVVQVLKKFGPGDYRDGDDLGTMLEPISNNCLQKIGPKLWIVTR